MGLNHLPLIAHYPLLMSLALPLFFLFCLPYHWAWNRRARQLQKEGSMTEDVQAQVGVWPPIITYPAASGDPPETGR
jgi:hypothetical protein